MSYRVDGLVGEIKSAPVMSESRKLREGQEGKEGEGRKGRRGQGEEGKGGEKAGFPPAGRTPLEPCDQAQGKAAHDEELDTTVPQFLDFPVAAVRSPPIRVEANNLIMISVLVKRVWPSASGVGGIIVRRLDWG